MKFKTIKNRIYADYFMPNRYGEYEEMLKKFLNNDFKFLSLYDYYNNRYDNDEKVIVIRHDIDSDLEIAKKMFEIENRLNIKSTYYFRLKTIDEEFMKELVKNNIEVGYHFEEVATYAKRNKIDNKKQIYEEMNNIVEEFEENLLLFKNMGIEIHSVSSHGDWKNREIGIRNLELINENLLKKYNIFEAYTAEDNLEFRNIDNFYPNFWVGGDPKEILENNY